MSLEFATPALLLLLPAALALALMPLYARGWSRPAGMRFGSVAAAARAAAGWKLAVRPYIASLGWIALALLVIAAARPQSSESQVVIDGEGVDIALALDISGSMAAFDFAPESRLEAAKHVIAEFIEQREYDRIGMVVFASDAFVYSPPTIDHNALKLMLADVELAHELRLEDGTAIGMGLAAAANMLKDSEAESKVIVLLTDGINNKGEVHPLTAAAAAETLGIRVYTVGMENGQGTTRRGLRRFDVDEDMLQEIADKTGGRYFLATDSEGLRVTYDEISDLEKSDVEVAVYTQRQELAGWVLAAAAALLFLELAALGTVWRSAP